MDIVALRRGPDSVPASWLVLLVALLMMFGSSFAAVTLIDVPGERDHVITWSAYGLGIAFYAAVIYLSGRPGRLLQALSCIIACGSLITLLFVAEFVLVTPLLGREFAGLVATLIVFWSVPVEGHIVARAIDQHWFVGIVIAIVAFTLQYGLQSMFRATS